MGSVEEEDLTTSVDFEFYDPGGHKEENVTFNKVYNKPPPGRQHRSFSASNKVCYEISTYNETNKTNDQQHETSVLDELEMNKCKKDSVLLINGARKEVSHTTRNDEEDEHVLFVSSEEQENDFQSGLDVSISDDTEDDDVYDSYTNNDDLLGDEITDDEEDEDVQKEQSLLQEDAEEELNYSGSESSKTKNLGRRRFKSDNLHGIVVPSSHHRHHYHQYGSASCSSESSSSVNNDSNESDLSSLDDDDDDEDDDDEDCCSDDEEEDVDNITNNDSVGSMKSLGKNGPTPPRKILHKNGLSFAERYSLHKSKRNNCNNHISSSSPNQSDMNCNNIEEEDCSSASEMTDVSPLASSADNSPTIIRKSKSSTKTTPHTDTIISVCNKNSPTLNGKNGFSCKKASDYSDMDMNLIMQAVEEISKEDEEKWKRCSSKISSSSSSSSPIRKRNNNRTNITYSNERARQIEKENERLLSQLLKLSSAKSYKVGKKVPLKPKVSHSAINRQREQRRIDKENEAFLRRLQLAKPTRSLSREQQLEEYNSKHLKCPRNKSTRNNGSPFKRPFTATSSSSRNSIISLATDTNSIALSKRSVYHQSTPTISNRPEWVSKW